MVLLHLIKVLGYMKSALSYCLLLPYIILMVPLRATYHLSRILLSPDLAKYASTKVLPSEASSGTSNISSGVYEDFEDYEYPPLPGERCIRLLRMHAPSKNRKQYIECELYTLPLDHPLIGYNALSYTWDGQKPDRYILCDGKRLPVTRNCESILRKLRPDVLGIVLWIDAICIDQKSLDEKANQVPLMSDIYRHATNVTIWFGVSPMADGLIFNYLWLLWCFLSFPESISFSLNKWLYKFMIDRKHTGLIQDLAQRNWWQRVWTIQESALAPSSGLFAIKTTNVRYGTKEIPFDMLAGGISTLQFFEAFTNAYPLNNFVWSAYQIAHHQPRMQRNSDLDKRPHVMMFRNRACGVAEPKDRVYGVYGMLLEQGLKLPDVSYAKTVDKIYWEFTVALCQRAQNVKLLELVSGLGAGLEAPSWVPDFDEAWRVGDLLGMPNATKDSQAEFQFSDNDRTLVVRGKLLDFVSKKSNLTTWQPEGMGAKVQDGALVNLEEGYERTIRAFRDMTRVLLNHGSLNQYEDQETFMLAFGEALTQGIGMDLAQKEAIFNWIGWVHLMLTEENRAIDLAEVKEIPFIQEAFYQNPERQHLTEIEEWQALCTLKTHPRTARLHHVIWMLTRDRIFFTTARGFLGTGPCSIEEHDLIALIAGVDRPMVLRLVDEDEATGHFTCRVVGPAYIAGAMEGELWEESIELRKFHLV